MTKILITGGNGQLGSEIKALANAYPDFEFIFTDVEDLDITNQAALDLFLTKSDPAFIVNCAAYTAVDKAESDLELATKINSLAPKLLAEASKKYGISLIHISTDYVFDGTAHIPYKETVAPSPDSAYGRTKLEGELNIQSSCEDYIIIRTAWLYSAYGKNFVKTMLKLGSEREELGVIFDQVGTPTYAADLAQAILDIILAKASGRVANDSGIYHYTNEGVCSWYDFSNEIFRIEGIKCRVKPIETVDYPTPARRPHYSVLNKKKIKTTYDLTIPHWKDSLEICLNVLKAN